METERDSGGGRERITFTFRFDRPPMDFESSPMDVSCYPTAILPGGPNGRVDAGSPEEPPEAPGTSVEDPHPEDAP